jgi:putative RNA 2'-phosphotransferase
MANKKTPKQLSKLISYILGRRPDEFGLVLNPEGFVKMKELLKAIHEEDGWKYVRRSHIDEILVTLPDPPVETRGHLIRATHRNKLPRQTLSEHPPKLLFTCVRRKAHPWVMEKGIFPAGFSHVILSSNRELAERMGRRMDSVPVLLTVQVETSIKKGIVFYQAGEAIYLAESIRVGCFTGPPVPKYKQEQIKAETKKEERSQRLAGSFVLELKNDGPDKKTRKRKKKKRKRERPPWRS